MIHQHITARAKTNVVANSKHVWHVGSDLLNHVAPNIPNLFEFDLRASSSIAHVTSMDDHVVWLHCIVSRDLIDDCIDSANETTRKRRKRGKTNEPAQPIGM
jgi:hypothetical protein